MIEAFAAKLDLALKAMSVSRGRLAADLGVDKSIVGRWARGDVAPSADNLARLTGLIARAFPGFGRLDWERDLEGFAQAIGLDSTILAQGRRSGTGSPFHDELIEEARRTSLLRGGGLDGFYRSTRPFASRPGQFIHDHMMVWRETDGLPRFDLRCDRVRVTGWILPQHNQLFIVGAEDASGSAAFGIFNGVTSARADVVDGLLLSCALDASRTPTATAMVFERVGNLTGDAAIDEGRLKMLAGGDPLAPEGSVPPALAAHLVRDIGPAALAAGGDWLLRMPLSRTVARGPGVGVAGEGFARAFGEAWTPAGTRGAAEGARLLAFPRHESVNRSSNPRGPR